ncbi:MAG: IPT/TIG domain-containing protein, partial [Coriobacteriia bacterium]|nr:IPT/TIG domain-containing protein [Coriobacteriia bacterium]
MVSGTSANRRMLSAGLAMALALALSFVPGGTCFSADVPIATVAVGQNPAAIAVNPITHRVFVTNYFGDSVSIIDGVSDVVTATVSTSYNGSLSIPISVVCNPLATPPRAYVANFWNSRITVINETSGTVLGHVASNGAHAGGPRALALDVANDKLYVAEYGGGSVTVFDALTYAQLKQITVGSSPRALGIFSSLPRTRIYVANRNSNSVSVIDGDTDTVVATLAVGAGPKAIAVDSSTGYAYVTCESANTVAVIDDSDVVTATIEVGQRPVGIAVDEVNGRVFVGNFNSGTVSVLRTSDFSHEATLTVGTQPWAVAFDSGDEKAFVTNYGSNNVSSIDNALSVTPVVTGTNPYAIAVNEGIAPHKVYAGNWGSNNVTVIDEPASSSGSSVASTFGGGRASAVESLASLEPVVSVRIDPLAEDPTFETAPTLSGTATSNRAPYAAAVAGVFYRADDEVAWRRAEITGGEGTPHVTWSASLGPLGGGAHSLEVMAMDQTGVAAAVSDGGTAVKTSSADGSAKYSFTVLSKPVVTSASTYNGAPGSSVIIQGGGFGDLRGSGWVTFAGKAAEVVSWSETAVTCTVPAGAQPGYVGVWQNGVCSNGLYFVPSTAPRVESLSTGSAAYGETITITGSGFGDSQGSGSVTFGGMTAAVTSTTS